MYTLIDDESYEEPGNTERDTVTENDEELVVANSNIGTYIGTVQLHKVTCNRRE